MCEANAVELKNAVDTANKEIANELNLSERTVKNYWSHARVWLFREIETDRTDG